MPGAWLTTARASLSGGWGADASSRQAQMVATAPPARTSATRQERIRLRTPMRRLGGGLGWPFTRPGVARPNAALLSGGGAGEVEGSLLWFTVPVWRGAGMRRPPAAGKTPKTRRAGMKRNVAFPGPRRYRQEILQQH